MKNLFTSSSIRIMSTLKSSPLLSKIASHSLVTLALIFHSSFPGLISLKALYIIATCELKLQVQKKNIKKTRNG